MVHRACSLREESEMVKLRTRCLLMGDAAVGKSSLCHIFHSEGVQFQRSYNMTAGVELVTKCVTIPESGHSVELYLVDCPGKDLLAEACEKMWGEAWLLCLVFDLSSEQSFHSCTRWLQRVQDHCLGSTVSGVLLGNKCDLEERRAVQTQEAQAWAQAHSLDYYETSAKELDTSTAPLLRLAQTCLSLYEQSCERTHSLVS
ncbi:intraflagellar transport protein 27 homolog [Boleophthalmus pectinirostris]|uniref:intraflagellar transport protein 27 homolog n=1 Tax=Boleophthalmus pectinirostris TaxID=150288 RepID=UPI0024325703|nr:intraflagellar transport protein 27 homolog [Boleophthalmus pectinirostris]